MEHRSEPIARRPWSRITLAQMPRLKEWREAQRGGRALAGALPQPAQCRLGDGDCA